MRIDLHLHTTCSDGVWPAARLFDEIRARELELFCVSDHDCVDAYPVPSDLRDRVIPGLEVDAHHGGHTTHILAYGIDDPQCDLLLALQRQRDARKTRMLSMIERVNGLGLAVTMEEVQLQAVGSASYGRPHLARALLARGHVASVQDAFDRYLADEGPGFVALERFTAAQAIERIHACGGVAVVAHPARLKHRDALAELAALGADGVEVAHPTADDDMQRELREFAASRGLLVTGGTDFHMPVEGRPIGVEFGAFAVDMLREAMA